MLLLLLVLLLLLLERRLWWLGCLSRRQRWSLWMRHPRAAVAAALVGVTWVCEQSLPPGCSATPHGQGTASWYDDRMGWHGKGEGMCVCVCVRALHHVCQL